MTASTKRRASKPFSPPQRRGRDRDFIRTQEGLFFCVTGYLHPPDRYTAYLKYSPDPSGKWSTETQGYRRELTYYHVRNVKETIRYLERHYPAYVHDCPVRDIRFSMVPHAYIARYYEPQQRLQEILTGPRDPLEEEVLKFATELATAAGINVNQLGITGSILIELHNPAFSDIDILVYGTENARQVQKACDTMRRDFMIQPLDHDYISQWIQRLTERFPLDLDEARYLSTRRWNYGYFNGRYFSIHPTRTGAEITEIYGRHNYRGRGAAQIRATVADATEGLFMPAVYRVADIKVLNGAPEAQEISWIIAHEGLYCGIVDAGQSIEVYGKLETRDGAPYSLVVGTWELEGQGYIKPTDIKALEA